METSVRIDSPPQGPFFRRRGEKGFTIVEVTMAAAVMALALTSSIIVLQHGFKMLDVARGTTLASQVLQSEMESLRLKSWSAIEALGNDKYYTTVFTSDTDTTLAEKYPVTRTVTSISSDIREITLSVTWESYDGRSHTRTFRTQYCKDGLYDYYYTIARS